MATLMEIAKKASVSVATVSRVLNCDASMSVSQDTRMRILKIAEDLEYVTVRERKISEKKDELVFGILDWYGEDEMLDDPYYLYLMTTVERSCSSENINIVKIRKDASGNFVFADSKLDGVIAIGRFSDKEIKTLSEVTENIVFVDSSPYEKKYPSVSPNHRMGITEALEYLIDLGHQWIGYIGAVGTGNYKEVIVDYKKKLFNEILNNHNIYNAKYDFIGESRSSSEGYNLMKKAINSGDVPTAFFIANDTMATGALRAILEANFSVPGDISIVGYNDLATSKYLSPPLTSVKIPIGFMAETAVQLLREKICNDAGYPKKILVPTELVVRESCKKIGG